MSDNTNNDTNKKTVPEIKQALVLSPGITFMANGTEYTVSESFTIGRMGMVMLMEEELSMFSNRGDCHKVMISAMKLMDELKQGEAYALLYNKVKSDRDNARLMHFTLRLCTAYINYKDEDLKYLTEEQITKKITDWSEEGLDIRPFIYFAMHVFKELLANYKKDILTILTEAQSIKEAYQKETDISNMTVSEESGEQQ